MSIAEFLDGMPSFDEHNFSRFRSDNGQTKHLPVYITTNDHPSDQIVNEEPNSLPWYLHKPWDIKPGSNKRQLDPIYNDDEFDAATRKRRRLGLGYF